MNARRPCYLTGRRKPLDTPPKDGWREMETIMFEMKSSGRLVARPRVRRFPPSCETVHGGGPLASLVTRLFCGAALVLSACWASAGVVFSGLYAFAATNDGANPVAGLVQASDGYFYGTTGSGGTNGSGTVFKISAEGSYASLYSFTGGDDGGKPVAGLVQGDDGYLYGTTEFGGRSNAGTVFRISTNGELASLYSFTGGADGKGPFAALAQGGDGYFYGTTSFGGVSPGLGTVFRISGNGPLTSLRAFTGGNDGLEPQAALVLGADGIFYGTTSYGTVYTTPTTGALTNFDWPPAATGGGAPGMWLAGGSDGYFYGTTPYGLRGGPGGTVFKVSSAGQLTNLFLFTWYDGFHPDAALVQASDGYLYGTTAVGGTNGGYGTVFKISTNGAFSSLYSFTGTNDGALPEASLVQGADGSFYGTTSGGGQAGLGTVFRLTILPEFQAVALTNGALNLTWSVEAGGTYQLQYNSNLSSSNWVNVDGAVVATGATLSATDSVTNGPQRFYRVMLLP